MHRFYQMIDRAIFRRLREIRSRKFNTLNNPSISNPAQSTHRLQDLPGEEISMYPLTV